MPSAPEAWLRGPIPGIDPMLQPAELWTKPGGAASVGFHLKHICGSLGRLLTYARGRPLDPEQLRELAAEGKPGDPPEELFAARTVAGRPCRRPWSGCCSMSPSTPSGTRVK
jgi:hypothetical protein